LVAWTLIALLALTVVLIIVVMATRAPAPTPAAPEWNGANPARPLKLL